MASIVLAIAGGVIGGAATAGAGTAAGVALGGTLGAAIGGAVGTVIDQTITYPLLFPPKAVNGPQASDTQTTTATEGAPINFTLGSVRVAGTVIWATPLIQHKHSSGGGLFGGPEENTFTYTCSFAVLLGYGERTCQRIWLNGKMLYKNLAGVKTIDSRIGLVEIYTGDLDQMPSPTIVAQKTLDAVAGDGPELVPAWRGYSYIVIKDLLLTDFGDALPQEIEGRLDQDPNDDSGIDLNVGIKAIFDFAGFAPSSYDLTNVPTERVRGMLVAGPTDVGKYLDPLILYHQIVVQETNGTMFFTNKAATGSVTIDDSQMGVGDPPPDMSFTVSDQSGRNAPSEVQVTFIDGTNDFQQGMKSEKFQFAKANNVSSISLPLNVYPNEARSFAKRQLWSTYAQLQTFNTTFGTEMLPLQEGDTIIRSVAGRDHTLRVTDISKGWNQAVEVDAAYEQAQTQFATAPVYTPVPSDNTPITGTNVLTIVMDIPPLYNTQVSYPGVYLAVCRAAGETDFSGATIFVDPTNTSTFADTSSIHIADEATVGTVVGTLANPPSYPSNPIPAPVITKDGASTLDVSMLSGTLASASTTAVMNGANWAMVGNEMIGFETVVKTGPSTYRLTNLYRGIRDTFHACTGHGSGETFVLLDSSVKFFSLPIDKRQMTINYLPVPQYGAMETATQYNFTWNAENVKPFRVYNITATRGGDGGLLISWTHQSRFLQPLLNFGAGISDESPESYELQILDHASGLILYSDVVLSTSFNFTAALQGERTTVGAPVDVKIRSMGSLVQFGRQIEMDNIPAGSDSGGGMSMELM